MQDKIIDKIKKLLSMADDVSSPNEAMIAARQARKLMDKHDLTMDQIKSAMDKHDFLETVSDITTKQRTHWMSLLVSAAGALTDTVAVLSTLHDVEYKFRGFKADAICAKMMFEYLVSACENAVKKSDTCGRSEKHYFRIGFCNEILIRAREIEDSRKKSQVDLGTGTSLMVVKKNAIMAHFGQLSKGRRFQTRRLTDSEFEAYNNGVEQGRITSLNDQVTGKEQVKLR